MTVGCCSRRRRMSPIGNDFANWRRAARSSSSDARARARSTSACSSARNSAAAVAELAAVANSELLNLTIFFISCTEGACQTERHPRRLPTRLRTSFMSGSSSRSRCSSPWRTRRLTKLRKVGGCGCWLSRSSWTTSGHAWSTSPASTCALMLFETDIKLGFLLSPDSSLSHKTVSPSGQQRATPNWTRSIFAAAAAAASTV